MSMSHPFGDRISQHLHRKHGLSQAKLAEGILQDPSIIGKMCKGERLHGVQARERVCAIIDWLHQQAVLTTVAEANGLLDAAGMATLRTADANEARLLQQLRTHAPEPTLPTIPRTLVPTTPNTNLPAPLTSFVGRAAAVIEVTQLVANHRLVTLTGAGGVGKTRLALEVGRVIVQKPKFPNGVWFVDLAPLTDPTAIPQRILDLWRVPEQAERSPLETLIAYLRAKEALLILDNCEHLIGACAELVETLLQQCPQLSFLATSRETLNIGGETPWRVPSLTRPHTGAGWDGQSSVQPPLTLEALARFEAAVLFVERARVRQPGFALTIANAPAIAQICSRLDGIPLALEMAAARVTIFTVEELAKRLDGAFDGRFQLLTNGARTAPLRQQTLRATMEWSYGLLLPDEQRLLTHLSVFTGSWSAAAAEAVTGETLDLLAQLVNKSLVIANQQDGHTRYRLLETIRQFATEQARADAQMQRRVQQQHSSYYLRLLGEQEERLQSQQQRTALAIIRSDLANISAAWQWAVDQHKFDLLHRATHALFLYCEVRGAYREGGALLAAAAVELTAALPSRQELQPLLAQVWGRIGACEAMLNNGGDASNALQQGLRYATTDQERAFALAHLGHAEMRRGEVSPGVEKLNESLLLSQQCGDIKSEARARHARIWYFPDFTEAIHHCEESLVLWREIGRPDRIAEVLSQLAWQICCRGDYAIADAYWEESMAVSTSLGMQYNIAWILDCRGWMAWCQGDLAIAQKYLRDAESLYHAMGMSSGVAMCQAELALVLRSAGELAKAVQSAREAVALARDTGDQMMLVLCFNYLGATLIGSGNRTEARYALREAIEQVLPTRHTAFLLNTLYYFAELLMLECYNAHPPDAFECQTLAVTLLSCVRTQKATWQIYKNKAAQLQAEIEEVLPAEMCAAAIARGQNSTLDEMVVIALEAVTA
ncbi:MAG: hypothetical protein DYG89_00190 [Caldilinea sp. CFX5]|nr:hypothetical protein [Caldilinea sp. CFX5]